MNYIELNLILKTLVNYGPHQHLVLEWITAKSGINKITIHTREQQTPLKKEQLK